MSVYATAVVFVLITLYFQGNVYGRSLVTPKPPTKQKSRSIRSTIFLYSNDGLDKPQCTTIDSFEISSKNGLKDQTKRWEDFNIYLDPSFDNWERKVINTSVRNLQEALPCVNFSLKTDQKPDGDYVHVVKGKNNGCNSHVGKIGGGQVLNLQSPGCMEEGIVIHELLHALGLYHEQSRQDRDDYIDIIWENIKPEFQVSFTKRSSKITSHYNIPYNQNSIMHYGSTAFSKNGKETMTAKNARNLGSTGKLQHTDILKLRTMYNCHP